MIKRITLAIAFLFSSCGYQVKSCSNETLSLSYVGGDHDGFLTSAIVKQILAQSQFNYQEKDGDYQLKVRIIGRGFAQIGYMHDRDDNGTIKENILPTEGRNIVTVEVILAKRGEDDPFIGPLTIAADMDFDFIQQDALRDIAVTNSGVEIPMLNFSLGQLENSESAQEGAAGTLYRRLAIKIVDALEENYKKL